jgi:hypothetical protein
MSYPFTNMPSTSGRFVPFWMLLPILDVVSTSGRLIHSMISPPLLDLSPTSVCPIRLLTRYPFLGISSTFGHPICFFIPHPHPIYSVQFWTSRQLLDVSSTLGHPIHLLTSHSLLDVLSIHSPDVSSTRVNYLLLDVPSFLGRHVYFWSPHMRVNIHSQVDALSASCNTIQIRTLRPLLKVSPTGLRSIRLSICHRVVVRPRLLVVGLFIGTPSVHGHPSQLRLSAICEVTSALSTFYEESTS